MNNNYINIKDIPMNETKTSPFAVYPSEMLSVREVPSPRSLYITDIDKTILVALQKYLLLTSRMVVQVLKSAGMENIDQRAVQQRLRLLCDSAHVQCSRFINEDGSYSANNVYSVGYRGRGYLKSIGVQTRLGGYVAQLEGSAIKRYLSVNQYLIATGQDYHATEIGRTILVPAQKKERTDKIFRAYGMVQGTDTTLFVEAVRRGDDWQAYIVERLDRMNATLKARGCNTELRKDVKLVLIAESGEHLKKLSALLKNKRYGSFEILLTTDLLVHNHPERCLVERERPDGFFRSLFTAACY